MLTSWIVHGTSTAASSATDESARVACGESMNAKRSSAAVAVCRILLADCIRIVLMIVISIEDCSFFRNAKLLHLDITCLHLSRMKRVGLISNAVYAERTMDESETRSSVLLITEKWIRSCCK